MNVFSIIRVCFSVVVINVSCLLSNVAVGQVVSTFNMGSSTLLMQGTGNFLSQQANGSDVSNLGASSGHVVYKGVGDWSLAMPRVAESDLVNFAGVLQFTVGNLPVQIQQMTFGVNAKWVNGGGTANLPHTSFSLDVKLNQALIPGMIFLNDPTILDIAPTVNPLVGNGLAIHNDTFAATPGYVLAAGITYYFGVSIGTQIDTTGFTSSTPSIAVTNEFGGNLSSGSFNGFQVDLQWQTVPEPASFVLGAIGCAAAGAFGWRRSRRPWSSLRR